MVYIPILKPKAAELTALAEADSGAVMPLIELTGAKPAQAGRPAREDREGRSPKSAQSVEDHLADVHGRLTDGWPDAPLYLDPALFLYQHPDALDALVLTLEDWRSGEPPITLVPVLRMDARPAVTLALGDCARSAGGRAALRLTRGDLMIPGIVQDARATLAMARLSPGAVDVILDAGCLQDVPLTPVVEEMVRAANALHGLGVRSIITAGTGYSENLNTDAGTIPRHELTVWNAVQQRLDGIPVSFCDYGVDAPAKRVEPGFVDASMQFPAVAVRYTFSDHWLYLKEASTNTIDPQSGKPKRKQGSFRAVCRRLVASPKFLGPGYSAGDQYFQDMAAGVFSNDGQSTAWRQAMYSHHFTFIQQQLQNDEPGASDADDEWPS